MGLRSGLGVRVRRRTRVRVRVKIRIRVRVGVGVRRAPAAEEGEQHSHDKVEHAHEHERHAVAHAHARGAAEGARHDLQQQQRCAVRHLQRHLDARPRGAAPTKHALPERVLLHTDDGGWQSTWVKMWLGCWARF